jgi:hypothetical protein
MNAKPPAAENSLELPGRTRLAVRRQKIIFKDVRYGGNHGNI